MKWLSLIGLYFSVQCASSLIIDLEAQPAEGKKQLKTKYDYIIVGGGTSGLTAARRLSEDKSKTVLVLEAGGSGIDDDVVVVPKNSFSFVGSEIDWFFSITNQTHAGGRDINLSQGKILGGDSSVNGLVWVRGAKEEYDSFEVLGNKGWNWDSFYKYMTKSEDLQLPSSELSEEFGFVVTLASHGSDGPVQVSFPPYLPIQHQKLMDAGIELGHPFNPDPYSGNPIGPAYSLSSQTNDNERDSAEFAYLDPVMKRKNLVVLTHATVSKVNLATSGSKKKASGVQVLFPDSSSTDATAKSKGEVILAAGVVRTPQILELSGVGNKEILKPKGIKTLVDLPGVGEHYEDHTLTILTYQLKEPYLSFDALSYNTSLATEMQTEWDEQHLGWYAFAQGVVDFEPATTILTAAELLEAEAILATKPEGLSDEEFKLMKAQVFDGTPQIEFLLFNSFSGGEVKEDNTSYVSLAVTHTHPMSRGSIHLNTTDINDHPIIDAQMLSSDWDAWFLAKATAYGRKLMTTKAFGEILEAEVYPGEDVQTHDEWVEFTRGSVNAGYHSIGSASMLPKKLNGVVDADLKVYGTTNLRVIDLSAQSTHISAHTQTIAYAFGEHAAEIIARA